MALAPLLSSLCLLVAEDTSAAAAAAAAATEETLPIVAPDQQEAAVGVVELTSAQGASLVLQWVARGMSNIALLMELKILIQQ